MSFSRWAAVATGLAASAVVVLAAQQQQPPAPPAPQGGGAAQAAQAPDPVRDMVARLTLDQYKATIKGLTQFGDRRQGTKRNRDALDWIEAQLKSYGCTNTERITYMHPSAEARDPDAPQRGGGQGGRGGQGARAGGAGAGAAGAAGGDDPETGAGRQGRGGGRGQTLGPLKEPVRNSSGGSTLYGSRGRTGVYQPPPDNTPPPNATGNNATPLDPRLYELNKEPAPPNDPPSQRQNVYCTKIGTTRPDEMYILGAHMDGHGWGEAANDDGSGTALVMQLARVFSSPDVQTERSIRFILWNNEETGLNGAWAYVNQRKNLQGLEDPKGSGRYPEPKWLGMIQHDMMMWDHGMPRADGSLNPEQRPEADVNVEWQNNSKMAEASMKLALFVKLSADKYTTDYPATLGPHMTNTDSTPFMNLVPAISLRENERGMHTGSGWNPTWHQPIDVFTTFSDKDFKLGLNAAQTTLSAIAQLTGATIKK
jgi:peptidase M28-like protein